MNRRLRMSAFERQCLVTAAVNLTTVCCGSALGFPAILLPQLRDPASSIHLTKEAESWIASVCALGMLVGYFLTPPIMDRLGRKKAHCFVSVLFVVGWCTIMFSTSAQVLFIGRILHGIAGGIMAPLGTVLVGECTSPKNRGAFLTTITLSQSIGILYVHFLGSIVSWETTAFICIAFPLASLIMSIYTPESPSWLLSRGRYDKFKEVFRWYRGEADEDELTSMIEAKSKAEEIERIKDFTRNGGRKNCFVNLKEVILKKEFYKPIIIMVHSNNLLQFAGGTLLITYATIIIAYMMGPNTNAYAWTVFMDVWRIFANIIAIFVIHKFNRRTTMFSSGLFCIFCNIIIACYLRLKSVGIFEQSSWIPVVVLSLELFANGVGIVPIRNVMAGELFPLRYRSIGGSISFATGSIIMFIVLKTFPALVNKLDIYGAYAVYAGVLIYSLLIILIMLPETKGRTLQQIEDDFKGQQTNSIDVTRKRVSDTTVSLILSSICNIILYLVC